MVEVRALMAAVCYKHVFLEWLLPCLTTSSLTCILLASGFFSVKCLLLWRSSSGLLALAPRAPSKTSLAPSKPLVMQKAQHAIQVVLS